MATSPNAATRVFGITELLEHILTDVSALDLIHLQSVSRSCKNTIEGSSVLQRIIYPELTDTEFAWVVDEDDGVTLSKGMFGYCIEDVVPVADLNRRYPDRNFAYSAKFNELLLRKKRADIRRTFGSRIFEAETLSFNEKANQILFAHDRPLSCDKMFLANIPITELEVLVECDCDHTGGCFNYHEFRAICNSESLRVSEIRQHVRGICSRAQSVRVQFAATSEEDDEVEQHGIVFPTEAEADWVKKELHIDL